jgi:hypothetical protein
VSMWIGSSEKSDTYFIEFTCRISINEKILSPSILFCFSQLWFIILSSEGLAFGSTLRRAKISSITYGDSLTVSGNLISPAIINAES